MISTEKVKLYNPFDAYFNQLATQLMDRAKCTTDDTKRSKLTKHTRTEREKVALDLKELKQDDNDELKNTAIKPSILTVYTANKTTGDKLDSIKKPKKGKKTEIKPDCGTLSDGITEPIADDVASDIYDDLIQQLGLDDKSLCVPDHQNPFKPGYLEATPPTEKISGFRRMLKSVRDSVRRTFSTCLRSSIEE